MVCLVLEANFVSFSLAQIVMSKSGSSLNVCRPSSNTRLTAYPLPHRRLNSYADRGLGSSLGPF